MKNNEGTNMHFSGKRAHQHIRINGKKMTVLSTAIRFPEGRLILRTDVFGQFSKMLDRVSDYEVQMSSGQRYLCEYVSMVKSSTLEKLEFRILRALPASGPNEKT